MPKTDAGKYIVDLKLATYTGLYQIINPDSPTVFGRNAYHVLVAVYSTYVAGVLVSIPLGLYHWTNDTSQFVMGVVLLNNYFFSLFKIVAIMRNSRKIWDCIEVTRVDFMAAYGKYDRTALNRCLRLTSKITYVYSVFCYFLLVAWYMVPFVLKNTFMMIKQRDGTYWKYRVNVHNLYAPVSVDAYNEHLRYFYVAEVAFGYCYIAFSVIFDTFMVSMCLAIASQMETVNTAFEGLGFNGRRTKSSTENYEYTGSKYTDESHRNLILLTNDYQSIIQKLKDFYGIVKPVILSQLAVASSTTVFLTFIIALNYSREVKESASSIQSLKMISALPVCIFQLFSVCYLFGNIHSKMNSINFAIYSCNWTEMDLQLKKFVLLKMNMNNASQMELKVTVTKIVNLEMFLSVMHMCYSVLSVMLNSDLSANN